MMFLIQSCLKVLKFFLSCGLPKWTSVALLLCFGVHLLAGLPIMVKKSFLHDIVCSQYGTLTREYVDNVCSTDGSFKDGNKLMAISEYTVKDILFSNHNCYFNTILCISVSLNLFGPPKFGMLFACLDLELFQL